MKLRYKILMFLVLTMTVGVNALNAASNYTMYVN